MIHAAAVIVLAAGYYVPDTGTAARAKGGAYVAMTGDPLQMIFNPAGLVGSKQQMLVDVTSLWQWETFERTDIAADSTAGTRAKNSPEPQIVPNLIYAHPIGDKLVIAGGIHAPAGPRYKFADRGPQRYSVSEMYLVEASYGVAVAYRAHKMVAVGLELEGMVHGVQHRLYVTQNAPPAAPTEAPANDVSQELDVWDYFTPMARIGVVVTPMEGLDIGLSYRPPAEAKCEGSLKSAATDDKVTFEFGVASVARAGVRFSRPAWDVEADFVLEDWSNHDVQVLTAKDGVFLLPQEGGVTKVYREFGTSTGVRVGGGWAATPAIRVLGGIFYETAAVPDKRLDAGSYDANKTGLNVGGQWTGGRFTVTGAYTHVLLDSRTITTSENRQQSPFDLDGSDPASYSVISNGKYSGSYDMLGVSLATRF